MSIEERETARRLQRRFLETMSTVKPLCNDELEERDEARRERFHRDAREWAQAVAGAIAALLLFGGTVLFVLWMDR